MEFRHLVATETSGLLSRLLVRRSEQSLRELADCRKTLEEAFLKIEAALREGARDQHEHEVPAVVERLTTAAAAETQASSDQARAEARKEVDALLAKADILQAEVQSERKRTAAALIELADARRDLQAKLDAARDTEEVLRERLVGLERALETAAARIDELPFDRLVAVYQELENGTSIMAVLIALAKGLLVQFSRVALFGVSDNRLEGVYQSGLDIKNDITDIAMPLTIDSILTQAASSGSIETLAPSAPTDQSRVPFGGTSGWCLALPVALRGVTIAVIYADDGNRPRKEPAAHQPRVNFADALRRHAVAVLRGLSVDLKAQEELRSYATLLLDEVEYVYEADLRAGKQNAELVERLTDVLRCAQESYARRVASAAVAEIGPDLFQDRLTALIDARATASFGRHLAIASYAIIKAAPMPSQPTAQA